MYNCLKCGFKGNIQQKEKKCPLCSSYFLQKGKNFKYSKKAKKICKQLFNNNIYRLALKKLILEKQNIKAEDPLEVLLVMHKLVRHAIKRGIKI